MVEVDIQVPEHLKTYFEEMSPIFCTCDVPVSAMGSLMQDHITKYNMSTRDLAVNPTTQMVHRPRFGSDRSLSSHRVFSPSLF